MFVKIWDITAAVLLTLAILALEFLFIWAAKRHHYVAATGYFFSIVIGALYWTARLGRAFKAIEDFRSRRLGL